MTTADSALPWIWLARGVDHWEPSTVPDNAAFTFAARPTHTHAISLVEWMRTHDQWVYLYMAGEDAKHRDLVQRAGLSTDQELSMKRYREHHLWCSQWWRLRRWHASSDEAAACLQECLYRGIIRLMWIEIVGNT